MILGIVLRVVIVLVSIVGVPNLPFILLDRNVTSGAGLGGFGQKGLKEKNIGIIVSYRAVQNFR